MEQAKRVKELFSYLKTNKATLSKEIGTSPTVFRNIETGRNGISAKIAKSITDIYPEISFDWLVDGTGEMIVEPTEDFKYVALEEEVKSLQNTNEKLELKIENLELKIENFKLKAAK